MRRAAGVLCLLMVGCAREPNRLSVEVPVRELPADGFSTLRILIRPGATLQVVRGRRRAWLQRVFASADRVDAIVRAGVLPGEAVLEARAAGFTPAQVLLKILPQPSEALPDTLRLTDEADRVAFAEWFAFLAEAQYGRPAEALPREIDDCAALIRFAYREALKEHNGAWADALALPVLPSLPAVKKYQYPYTPLGAALFETQARGGFAEFANAQTLLRFNTWWVSRDLRRANKGDLLFYRQLGQKSPFHAMIYLGDAVVYHTGPEGNWRGEIRRLTLEELLRYPQPQWRPAPANPNFLGVYRWNILK